MNFYTSDPTTNKSMPYPYCVLTKNNWNDWGFLTTFSLSLYLSPDKEPDCIGMVKIGQKNMPLPPNYATEKRTELPPSFTELNRTFFSVGVSNDYYKKIHDISLSSANARDQILSALKDIVFDKDIYFDNQEEPVMIYSLMRDTSFKTIKDVYSQVLATGKESLTEYKISIKLINEISKTPMTFNVSPQVLPQSNIHALIGRNGVGKTNLFRSIIFNLTNSEDPSPETNVVEEIQGTSDISSVLALSYSLFDTTLPRKSISAPIPYRYIGFSKETSSSDLHPKSLTDFIVSEFIDCVNYIRERTYLHELLGRCLDTLNSDPMFNSLHVFNWFSASNREKLKPVYEHLSSGHKIVLLSLLELIIHIEANSVVLIDEPEQNLHPPLISSFIQAILSILKMRNAIAIIATHSPVVVQECAKENTWILNRSGGLLRINRPKIKTFGANVGQITYDVFDLEVEKSGYMAVINKVINDSNAPNDFNDIVAKFQNKLGDESMNRIASLLYQKKQDSKNETDK